MPVLDLFAAQAHITPAVFRDGASFAAHAARLLERCEREREREAKRSGAAPALVVFPENIGAFLALTAVGPWATRLPSIELGVLFGILRRPLPFLRSVRRTGPRELHRAVLLSVEEEVARLYHDAFSSLARRFGVTLVAGSVALRGDDQRMYNTSVTFAEDGSVAARTQKVNLVPEIEDQIGLSPSRNATEEVAETAVGRVGTLICYDGFNVPHTTREPDWRPVGGTFTDQGVHIVAQPAANPWRWDEAWVHAPPGAGLLRREQWCAEGLEARLSELDGVSYGVTAHLVGRVLGQEFEGCSAIYQRSDTGAVRRLAEAPTKDQECVVHARVEAPWLA